MAVGYSAQPCHTRRSGMRRGFQSHDENFNEDNETWRTQQKGTADSEKKGRFGNPIKGIKEGVRPLTGMFRKTGKSAKRSDHEDTQEPTVAAPPTNFPNMARISATIESVQINDDNENYRGRNPDTGSKLTLSDGAIFANVMHPLTHYFKVNDVDISSLGRSFPTACPTDEGSGWLGHSLFQSLERKIKEERTEIKDTAVEMRTRNFREGQFSNKR